MLTVGDRLPPFRLTACVGTEPGREFAEITDRSHPGRWLVLFAWPMDFTFVCPTEIAAFGARAAAFEREEAQVLGLSTDTHYVHLAWRREHPALRDLSFPMLADYRRELSRALGILHPVEGVPSRVTFIVDPDRVIRHVTANDLAAGRNVDETLRTLAALRTGELTPCGWAPGEPTLTAA